MRLGLNWEILKKFDSRKGVLKTKGVCEAEPSQTVAGCNFNVNWIKFLGLSVLGKENNNTNKNSQPIHESTFMI